MNILGLLKLAGKVAISTSDIDKRRSFILGAIGIRNDGVLVSARNGAVYSSSCDQYRKIASSHAEVRCLSKCDAGSILFVARVHKNNGELAMSRPCETCQRIIKSKKVKRVYYTINSYQYGIWDPKTDRDIVVTKGI